MPIALALPDIRRQGDWACAVASGLCSTGLLLAGLLGQNAFLALVLALPMAFASWLLLRRAPGRAWAANAHAALLAIQGMLLTLLLPGVGPIGLIFPLLMSLLLLYRDPWPIVGMGAVALLSHLLDQRVLNAGASFGAPMSALLWPALAQVTCTAVLALVAFVLQGHAKAAAVHTQLLEALDPKHDATPKGALPALDTPATQSLTAWTQHMQFIVAGFAMLREDVRDLANMAQTLDSDHPLQAQDTAHAANLLRDFVQQLAQQTRLGQTTNQLSKKNTEDCFDLINGLNQSLDALHKLSQHSYDCRQTAQQLARDTPQAQQALGALASNLDTLNERVQQFLVTMELLKTGLNAVENQSVAVDRATHQWVENGHSNQRKGWEVLAAMEQLQGRAGIVFNTLHNGVQTILRTDNLMQDLERRLDRFKV